MTYYALLKSQGKLINSHPVIKKLIYLKYLIEKTKNIDTKLKPQIDKLIKLAENENEGNEGVGAKVGQAGADSKVYKPQLLDEQDEELDDEEEEEKQKKTKKNLKYKVESNFTDFYETKNEDKARKTKIDTFLKL